jgi:hypothetical protein
LNPGPHEIAAVAKVFGTIKLSIAANEKTSQRTGADEDSVLSGIDLTVAVWRRE